jgi:hypothetical protein
MTTQTKTVLKSYFNTGDKPTESQFGDLIDSLEKTIDINDFGSTQTAWQTAVTAGGTIRFTTGTYTLSGTGFTVPANTHIILDAGAVIDMSACSASASAFSITGTEATTYNLTANTAKNDTSCTISAANLIASGIVAGDWIRIASTTVFDASRTSSQIGELIKVLSVNTGTGVITFETPLCDAYTTAATGQVSKVTLVSGVRFSGQGKIKSNNTVTNLHAAIKFLLCDSPRVDGLYFEQMDDRAVMFFDCVYPKLFESRFDNFNSVGTGYGLSVSGASRDGVFVGMTGSKVRHLFTTNNSNTIGRGIPRRHIFSDWVAVDSAATSGGSGGDAIDTHAAAEDIHIWNGIVFAATGQGVNLECPTGSLVNVKIYGAGGNGVHLHNESDRAGSWKIQDVFVYNATGYGVYLDNPGAGSTAAYERLQASNITVTDGTDTGFFVNGTTTTPIRGLIADNIQVLRSASAVASIYLIGTYGFTLNGFSVENPTSVAQSALRIRDCQYGSVASGHAKMATSATGAVIYVNSTGVSTCKDILINGITAEATTPVNLRGLLVDANASAVVASNTNDFTACTTPYSPTTYTPIVLSSGTYTPTLTAVTNVAASVATLNQYLRVGSTVTVSGTFQMDPTATGAVELGISLPIASDFSIQSNLGGTAASLAGAATQILPIVADATNDRATVLGLATDAANRLFAYHFTYQII